MTTPFESGRLILDLYDLRREPVLREAREWFLRSFHPESVDDVVEVLQGADNAKYRMVTGYWDMAASLVAHGAIDREMFLDGSREVFATFANVQHLLGELREAFGDPTYLRHLEDLFGDEHDEHLATLRRQLRSLEGETEEDR